MHCAPPTPYHTPPDFLNGSRRFRKMTFSTTKSAKLAEKRGICITDRCIFKVFFLVLLGGFFDANSVS